MYKERVGIYYNKNITINTNEEAICSKRGEKIEKIYAQKEELVEWKSLLKYERNAK